MTQLPPPKYSPDWSASSAATFSGLVVANLTRMCVGFRRQVGSPMEWLGPRTKPTGSPHLRIRPHLHFITPEKHPREDCGWVDNLITIFGCHEVVAFDHTGSLHIRLSSPPPRR